MSPLCALPAQADNRCCGAAIAVPPAPIAPSNPPGRSVIAYRIGEFASFRRAMLQRLAASETGWNESRSFDYQVSLVELWAYLADILTFYQERIANEAYVGTATQRDSLRRIAELLGYEPSPASGAVGTVAFTIQKGKTVDLPPNFKVGNAPVPGQAPAVFETIAGFTARAEHNAIPLATRAPMRQFATSTVYGDFLGMLSDLRIAASRTLFGALGPTYLSTFAYENARVADADKASGISGGSQALDWVAMAKTTSASRVKPNSRALIIGRVFDISQYVIGTRHSITPFREVVLKGTRTELKPGDPVAVITNGGTNSADRVLRHVHSVVIDDALQATRIRWSEDADTAYPASDDRVEIYRFTVSAPPFGHDAPRWATLPVELTGHLPAPQTDDDEPDGDFPFGTDWDTDAVASFLPNATRGLLLDAAYEDANVAEGDEQDHWIVVEQGNDDPVILKVKSGGTQSVNKYALTGSVTQLQFASGENDPTKFTLRTSFIRAGSKLLELEPKLPLGLLATGSVIILDGSYPKLKDGQQIALYGPVDGGDPNDLVFELALIHGVPVLDGDHLITIITLKQPLKNTYVRASTIVMANLVGVTQGETVREEVLGSGSGAAGQLFKLKNTPLTYLPSSDAEGLSAVDSSLTVTVNHVRWSETPSLIGLSARDQSYETVQDDDEVTWVRFGDGFEGVRPPTGRDNIRARYRKGAGANGNVATSGVTKLVDSLPGVQKVTNPTPISGGVDRESVDGIRANAPASVTTFGRVVSASDFAALALRYPGIGKASAAMVSREPRYDVANPWKIIGYAPVAHPYVQLTVATADGGDLSGETGLLARLRAFLDARRDPNIRLRIQDVERVPIELIAEIDVESRFGREATLAAANAVVSPNTAPGASPGFFAFESLAFGESIHLSAVYAALQSVDGVAAVRIPALRRVDIDPAGTIRSDIFIRPNQIATALVDSTHSVSGRIELRLGAGGFDDA